MRQRGFEGLESEGESDSAGDADTGETERLVALTRVTGIAMGALWGTSKLDDDVVAVVVVVVVLDFCLSRKHFEHIFSQAGLPKKPQPAAQGTGAAACSLESISKSGKLAQWECTCAWVCVCVCGREGDEGRR